MGFDEARWVFIDHQGPRSRGPLGEGEERWRAIGYVDRVLLAVHTVREEGLDEVIRMISARKATPAERRL